MDLVELLGVIQTALGGRGVHAVIGAVARNAWAPPRATTDLDLTVAAKSDALQALAAALGAVGYQQVRDQRAEPGDSLPDIVVFRSASGRPRQVDVLVAKTRFEEEVIRRAELVEVGSAKVPVASPEDLIVYKLLADRPRDRDDIRAILRTQERAGRQFDWEYVERWTVFWQIGDRLRRLRAERGE